MAVVIAIVAIITVKTIPANGSEPGMPALIGSIARTAAARPLGISPLITPTSFFESFSLNVPIFTPIGLAIAITKTMLNEITTIVGSKNKSRPIKLRRVALRRVTLRSMKK